MTREEAIGHIKDIVCENNSIKPNMMTFEEEKEALYMAIKALEQEPIDYKAQYERFSKKAEIVISQLRADRDRLLDVLDKIKTEIEQTSKDDDDRFDDYRYSDDYIYCARVMNRLEKMYAESEEE